MTYPTGQPVTQQNGTGAERPPQRERDTEWALWFHNLLIDRRFAHLDDVGAMHFHIRQLERAILYAKPPVPAVPYGTLRSVLRLEALPTHATARGLAAALRVPELAILLMSGQLDKAAIAPLIGSEPAIIRTQAEYAAVRAQLAQEMPDTPLRAFLATLIDRDWTFSQWLFAQLDTFGISEAEWLAMRDFLNSPHGRDALRRAITGEAQGEDGGAMSDMSGMSDEPPLPDEFRQAEQGD